MTGDRSWDHIGNGRRCESSARVDVAGAGPRKTGRAAVVGMAALMSTVAVSGVAFAFWSASGSGTGEVGSATAAVLTVNPVTAPLTDLFPGKTNDLSFTVTNSNGYRVSLTTLAGASVSSSDAAACPASNITLAQGAGYVLPTPINVAPGATQSASVAGLVTMATSAPDGCQGKTFTISLSFSGAQY